MSVHQFFLNGTRMAGLRPPTPQAPPAGKFRVAQEHCRGRAAAAAVEGDHRFWLDWTPGSREVHRRMVYCPWLSMIVPWFGMVWRFWGLYQGSLPQLCQSAPPSSSARRNSRLCVRMHIWIRSWTRSWSRLHLISHLMPGGKEAQDLSWTYYWIVYIVNHPQASPSKFWSWASTSSTG